MTDRPFLTDVLTLIRKEHDRQRSTILRGWLYVASLWTLAEQFEADAPGRSASAEINGVGLRAQLHLAKADSFKAAAPFLAGLLEHGWTQTKASEDGNSRDFFFAQNGGELAVWVWPHRQSGHCKKVEIGVQTYKQYKIVCD